MPVEHQNRASKTIPQLKKSYLRSCIRWRSLDHTSYVPRWLCISILFKYRAPPWEERCEASPHLEDTIPIEVWHRDQE